MRRSWALFALLGTIMLSAQAVSSDMSTTAVSSAKCSREACTPCPGPCPLPCATTCSVADAGEAAQAVAVCPAN